MLTSDIHSRAAALIKKAAEANCLCPQHPKGCPGHDCDGCPHCLSGEARRITTTVEDLPSIVARNLYAVRCKGGADSAKRYQTQSNLDVEAVARAFQEYTDWAMLIGSIFDFDAEQFTQTARTGKETP